MSRLSAAVSAKNSAFCMSCAGERRDPTSTGSSPPPGHLHCRSPHVTTGTTTTATATSFKFQPEPEVPRTSSGSPISPSLELQFHLSFGSDVFPIPFPGPLSLITRLLVQPAARKTNSPDHQQRRPRQDDLGRLLGPQRRPISPTSPSRSRVRAELRYAPRNSFALRS